MGTNKTFKILSIDAWFDSQTCPDCSRGIDSEAIEGKVTCKHCGLEFDESEGTTWSWNNWFNVGTYDESEYGELTDENAKKYFKNEIVREDLAVNFDDHFEIDDDQYNLVLIEKKNQRPLYAIEYGSEEV